MKTMLFVRDFLSFRGGHLKVFDYFNHVRLSGIYEPVLYMTPRSRRDDTNPWFAAGTPTETAIRQHDAYFLAGMDWMLIDRAGIRPSGQVINLIQSVRHAIPDNPKYGFLTRPAVRVCVSQQVTDAIKESGQARGEIVTIPIGVDLSPLRVLRSTIKTSDVLVLGIKAPELAAHCTAQLTALGLVVDSISRQVSREAFLARLSAARVALLLPTPHEGFYLPPLEAMAVGTIPIVPDCVGNRGFCLDGVNCRVPAFELSALVKATVSLLGSMPRPELISAGIETADKHSLERERERFTTLLQSTG